MVYKMFRLLCVGATFITLNLAATINAEEPKNLSQYLALNHCKINNEWVFQKEPCPETIAENGAIQRNSGTLGVDSGSPILSKDNSSSIPIDSSVVMKSSSQENCVSYGQRTGFANKCKEVNKVYGKSQGYDEAGKDLDYSSIYYQYSRPRTQHVSGYTRSDGTYVRPYFRSR